MAALPDLVPPLNARIDEAKMSPTRGAVFYTDIPRQNTLDAERAARDAAMARTFGLNGATTSGLTWGYLETAAYGRSVDWGGARRINFDGGIVAAGTVDLEPNTINFVEFNVVTREVVTNTEAFTDGETALDLWEIETGSASIIRLTDRRRFLGSYGQVTEIGDGEGHDDAAFEGEPLEFDGEQITI